MGISPKLRKKFPVLRQGIYANTATSGLLSEDLLEWRQEHDLDFLIGGSGAKMGSDKLLAATRLTVARFFNFMDENVALVPSFSQGLNLLLEGLGNSEKILLLKGDYPSLNWPFESRDFSIVYLEIGKDLEERIYTEVKDRNITVFACSAVQWLNGFKIDFDFLKQLKADFPHLLVLMDGTQFCGTEYFDFSGSGIDVLGSSGYKWLLSGYGNGFFLVKPEIQDRFRLRSKGYGSGRNSKHQKDGREFCKHLEPGHLDSLSFGSLDFSMKFLMDVGLEAIGEHNQKLASFTKDNLVSHGLLDDVVAHRGPWGTIFNIQKKDGYDDLVKNTIVCARRGDGIRLSFHFYNTINEVEAILEILKK
ncbi:aminotransferase class V-fold PLP-dependent enzyme [Flavobacteriaceae bacterium GF1]